MTLWRLDLGHWWCPQWCSWHGGWGNYRCPLSFHFLLKYFLSFLLCLVHFCRMFGFSTECALQFLLTRCRTDLCTMILTFTFPASYLFMTAHCWVIFLPTFWHCSVCCWGWVVTDVIDCCEVIDAATFAVLATLVICKRGACTDGTWGTPRPTGEGTAMSILSCVVGCKTNWCNRLIWCLSCTGCRFVHRLIHNSHGCWSPNDRATCTWWFV